MLSVLSGALIAGALLAGSAQAGDHFILTQNRQLCYTRIDPLRTPGTVGPHVHNVVGGSNFSPDSTTPEILQQSKCSSTMVQDDKSIYWTPLVYYNHGNGSYSPMISSTRIYYFLKPGNGTVPVKPFPKGFRMLGGGYNDRRPDTYPPRGELSYDQLQALDPRIAAIKWGCSAGAVQGQGNGGSLPGQRPYLPNDAPNGCGVLNAGMFFPSCGDGRLDSDDHFSHMAYPLDESNGYNCPPSHPIKYPTIFLEHFYFPSADQPYRGANTDNWILSNGDPTGLNMHGDFINGWNQETHEQTLQQCNTPNAPEDNLQACAPLAKSINVDAANTCLSEGNIADEDVGLLAPITGFPGCNPYWGWESRTKASCVASSNVGLVSPSSRYTVDEFKVSLPMANGTSKTVTGPPGSNMTGDYDYYGSSSSYAATATSSYAATVTSTEPVISATETATLTTESVASTTGTASSEPTSTGEATSAEATPSSDATSTDTTSTAEAVPTETAATGATSTGAAPTGTASTEVSSETGTTATGTEVASTIETTSTGTAIEGGAAPTGSSTLEIPNAVPTSSVASNSSGASSLSAVPTSTASLDYEYPSVTPGYQGSVAPTEPASAANSNPTTSSSVPVQGAPSGATGTSTGVNQPAYTYASSPNGSPLYGASSTTGPAYAAPTSQNANTLNPGNNSGRPKTCRRKNHKVRSHARRHRIYQNRLSN
ncbi:hypothetical protein RSOLAG1IB_08095 [Rhizoctonia solani AG-1 IB]|uniref:DUF1996 domain-containing protein n=1 Tax=Thanatephorus cucumeris (strain AG1-IB / isolate 7/3/14) TaxID=1108050 RepID=A0A0B7FKN2_THACB|nr:hypothetical protein RSOLAG1IB_08095 [Rhizoctonia solani AG-1 IB]